MMNKINFKSIVALVFTLVIFNACQKEYEPEMIGGNELAGVWYVTYTVGGADIYDVGYTTILTSNAAAADGTEIVITDEGHFWDYHVKASANGGSGTFGSEDSLANLVEDYDINIVVSNGVIIPNGGRSKTGAVVDSIAMYISFADDPGNLFLASGHRRTGFREDDY